MSDMGMTDTETKAPAAVDTAYGDESYFMASTWELMRRKFFKHKLAILGGSVLIFFYLVGVIFTGFFSTHDIYKRHNEYAFVPPQKIRIFDEGRLRWPFVYGLLSTKDPETWRITYVENKEEVYPIKFFVRGDEYKLIGLFKTNMNSWGWMNREPCFSSARTSWEETCTPAPWRLPASP